MFFGVLIILLSVIINICIDAVSNNEDTDILSKKSAQSTFSDLNSENSFLDSSHQKYYQDTTPSSAQVTRDDSPFIHDAFDQSIRGNGQYPAPPARNSDFPRPGGKFYVDGIGNLDHRANSFRVFGQGSGDVNGNGHSYSDGSPSFDSHAGSPTSFGHGGGGSNFAGHGGGGSDFAGHGGGHWGYGGGGSDAGSEHSLQPVIHKSVYVHIAPPEEEVPRQKVIVPKIPPKKNYQIVFIKAPTPPPPSVPVIPPFPPQSDKTLIYVLHPKPEELPPIHIPAPPQNEPVKPEVYFIRYKSKKNNYDYDNGIDNDAGSGSGGSGVYQRRYGRDEAENENESLNADAADIRSKPTIQESNVSTADQYDEHSDVSGESSDILRVNTTELTQNTRTI